MPRYPAVKFPPHFPFVSGRLRLVSGSENPAVHSAAKRDPAAMTKWTARGTALPPPAAGIMPSPHAGVPIHIRRSTAVVAVDCYALQSKSLSAESAIGIGSGGAGVVAKLGSITLDQMRRTNQRPRP